MVKMNDENNSKLQPQSKYFGSYCDLHLQSRASALWRGERVMAQRGGLPTTPRPRGARCFTTVAVGGTRTTSLTGDIVLRSALRELRV